MPWLIKESEGKFCVYKEGETEPLHCYPTKKEAVDYMAALYANSGGKGLTPPESATGEVGKPAVKPLKFKALEYGTPLQIAEFKSEGDDWEVSGYVSIFNNIDAGGDIVLPGAFKKSLSSGRRVRFLFGHDPKSVLGVPKVLKEDTKGLFGKFKISKTRLGEETHQLLQDGAIDSFSFGYISQDEGYNDQGARELKALELHECSLVAIPMNPEAIVTGFKEFMTLADKTNAISAELSELLNDLRGLTDKSRPLSATKRQELMELLETFSGLDDVRTSLQSILTAAPSKLVGPKLTSYLLAEARKRNAKYLKE